MDHPLRFSRYNDWVAEATRVVLGHFRTEDVHIWPKWSLSICGPRVWLPGVLEEVAFWPIFHGPPPYNFPNIMMGSKEGIWIWSLIFHLRTVIFGLVVPWTHPVIGLSSDFHISKVANWAPTHLRAQKMDFLTPRWEASGGVPDGLGGPQMAQTQRILCCDNIRDHFGLIWDHFGTYSPIANFYYFPNIMTGLPEQPELFSLIFHPRTVIFGT